MLRFGTDGVRGEAFTQLTTGFARALGAAAAAEFAVDRVLIARDTRESGPALEAAFAEGVASVGAQPQTLGVAPTPAVAYLSATDGVAAAMISASHNPFADNGIKLFAPGGLKLDDATQDRVQARLDTMGELAEPAEPATIIDRSSEVRRYDDAVEASIDGRDLDGLRVVIDCANGSNSDVAEAVLTELGAVVVAIHDEPNGRNINDGCGSTHPDDLQAEVVRIGADVGIAFDGDADRVLAVDHTGLLVDGDQIMAVCAIDRNRRGALTKSAVVVTVMSNLGFRLGMEAAGIDVVETGVGDRYVLEALERDALALGGEQSGHVIFRELATTGDGLLTAVQLLDVVKRSATPLHDLVAQAMTKLPQVLKNTRVDGDAKALVAALAPAIEQVEADLGRTGRVLVRPSGTEPLIRVMAEAETEAAAAGAVDRLLEALRELAGDSE